MKIKNLKYKLGALGIISVLSLTNSCEKEYVIPDFKLDKTIQKQKEDFIEDKAIIQSSQDKNEETNEEEIKFPDEIEIPVDNLSQQYLEKEFEYYKEHPEKLKEDTDKRETIIDLRGNSYRKLISHRIIEIENEFLDMAYLSSYAIGNASSTGDGVPTKDFRTPGYPRGWISVAIVGVKSKAKYPFAVAEYDYEANTIGDIIGWFKDEDIRGHYEVYGEVIEMPVSKYLTFGNIDDFDIDETGHISNCSFWLPFGYTPLVENYRYGIRIHYTSEEKEGYSSDTREGLYIPIDNVEEIRGKLDEKNHQLVLKFGIKNN